MMWTCWGPNYSPRATVRDARSAHARTRKLRCLAVARATTPTRPLRSRKRSLERAQMASAEIPEPLPELPTPAVEVEVSFEQRDGLGLSTKRNQTVDLPQDGVVVPESERHLDRQCSLEVARAHLAAVED